MVDIVFQLVLNFYMQVGLVMTFFGVASVCSAILIGKVVGKYGRNPLYALAVIVDLICYARWIIPSL